MSKLIYSDNNLVLNDKFKVLSVSLWTPAEITTAAWFDAADASTVTLDAGNVSQWDDKSGNGNHAVQLAGNRQPAYNSVQINDLATLTFDPVNQNLLDVNNVFLDVTQPFSLFVVFRPTGLGARRLLLQQTNGTGTGRSLFYHEDTYNVLASLLGGGTQVLGVTPLVNGTPVLGEMTYTSGSIKFYLNGNYENTHSKTAEYADGLFRIGANKLGNGLFWQGEIAEHLCYQRVSDENRQRVEGYLAWKWGLESNLPIGHPYKSAPPYA